MSQYHLLTEQEQEKVRQQVEYFMEVVAKKYDISCNDVVAAVTWVNERKELADKLKVSGMFSILGITISAIFFAVWEGLKSILAHAPR